MLAVSEEATPSTAPATAPTGTRKKPASAPTGPTPPPSSGTGPVSSAGGTAAPPADDTLHLRRTADDLGMFSGALTTVPGLTEGMPTSTDVQSFEGLFGAPEPVQPKPETPSAGLQNWSAGTGSVGINGMPSNINADILNQVNSATQQQAEARDARETALPKRPRGEDAQAEPLTLAQYEALGPSQKAAIDFNTMLTQAVQRDKNMQDDYKPQPFQKDIYNEAVSNMFGQDGGSDIFAPETVAVLQQLKFQDPTADLDDFLKLKVAVTTDDLKDIRKFNKLPEVFGQQIGLGSVDPLTEIQASLANSTADMEQELAKGGALLQTMPALARASRNASPLGSASALGGVDLPVKQAIGFTQIPQDITVEQMNDQQRASLEFQKAYDDLATSGAQAPQKLADMLSRISDDYKSPFLSYLDARSMQSMRFGVTTPGYTSPAEFRVLLGLDPKEKP